MNRETLLEKAKNGTISRQEVAAVASELESSSRQDPYTLIHILGASGATEHEALVARFLDAHSDPMLARIGLQVLCTYWGKAGQYRDQIERFVRGVDWDADEDVRIAALSAAGELLREYGDTHLLGLLTAIFASAEESHMTRQAAYFALARAFGQEWSELPPASRRIDLDKDVDRKVVEWALRAVGHPLDQ